MDVKVKKTGVIVTLSLAAVFLAAAGLVWLIPDDSESSMHIALMIISLVFVFTFALSALVNFSMEKKRAKRLQLIYGYMAKLPYESFFVNGCYSEKGMRAKAAAKSAASAAGAILSALVLGIGFYKISSGVLKKEFIVADRGLLLITPHYKYFDPNGVVPVQGKDVYKPQIIEKKNQVILTTGNEKNGYFVFNLKNSGIDREKFITTLQKAFIPPIE